MRPTLAVCGADAAGAPALRALASDLGAEIARAGANLLCCAA